MVTVYTLPNCVQCRATTRFLDKNKIPYDTADARENVDLFRAWGYTSAPVVVPASDPDGHWSGYNTGRLKALLQ